MATPDPQHPTALPPLLAMARHWLLCTAITLLGLIGGIAYAWTTPTTYTAESRLSVAPADNSAYSIAGFPLAARDLAATYARWVQNNAADPASGWADAGVSSISASPIPESAVLRIEAKAASPEAATNAVTQAGQRLLTTVNEEQAKHDPKLAYRAFQQLAPKVVAADADVTAASAAVGRSNTAANQKALREAKIKLSMLQLEQDANGQLYKELYSNTSGISLLKEVAPAALSGDDRRSGLARWGLAGLGGGLVVSLVVATALARRDERRNRVRSTPSRVDPTTMNESPTRG